MAEQFFFDRTLRLPTIPDGPPEWVSWARVLQAVLIGEHQLLTDRIREIITVGVIADRPAANGTFRFYFSTDATPEKLYLDNGTWHEITTA